MTPPRPMQIVLKSASDTWSPALFVPCSSTADKLRTTSEKVGMTTPIPNPLTVQITAAAHGGTDGTSTRHMASKEAPTKKHPIWARRTREECIRGCPWSQDPKAQPKAAP